MAIASASQRHQHESPGREQARAVLGPARDVVAEALGDAHGEQEPRELADGGERDGHAAAAGPSARALTTPLTRFATSVSPEKT